MPFPRVARERECAQLLDQPGIAQPASIPELGIDAGRGESGHRVQLIQQDPSTFDEEVGAGEPAAARPDHRHGRGDERRIAVVAAVRAAVGRLAAAIAHEIRNPLTSIAGSVSMLSGIPEMNAEHRQLLDIVTRESQRLNGIITDFLAYSRGKQYRFEKTDLVPLLEDTLTLMRHRMTAENTGILIESRFDVREAWTLADGDKIKQVFWNFGENAVRAMRNGGTLKVAIERLKDDWQVSFADTGTGMTPQQTEKIFEPFQSNFEGGTGLGLAVVYQIVQAHEGKVWARSKPEQGTTFVLRLRRCDSERHMHSSPSISNFAAPAAPAQLATAAAEGRSRG